MTDEKTVAPMSIDEMLTRALSAIPGMNDRVITGNEVEYHKGSKIILPEKMTFKRAYDVLKRLEKEAEEPTEFSRTFMYRPDDGAHAAFQVVKIKWGMGLGKALDMGMFGVKPPEMKTISIGVNQTMQVPWGLIEIPTLQGLELYIGATNHRDYGTVFKVWGQGPKKYKDELEDFFDAIQSYLEEHSIYRGQAIIGSDDPQFLDLAGFEPSQIVFADDVMASLEGTLWTPLRYTDAMRRENMSLKRAVLLHGPFGTGKTSIGQLTAGIAVENGWTFISARPGRDKPQDALRTARLYQPAVVFIEDIDGAASTADDGEVTKLLDAFDGITSKGGEVIVALTTNHIERIHKGMLRPGRLDSVIHIESLDRNGTERLIRAVVDPAKLDPECDFDAIFKAMTGFYPAFVREAVNRAVTYALGRLEGERNYTISTPDLVGAAHSLQDQLKALEDASEGERRPTLDVTLMETIKKAITSGDVQTYDGYNGVWNGLKTPEQVEKAENGED
jgi:SpoVK/Ycf46/Vps4 family AAA+-type ATPase